MFMKNENVEVIGSSKINSKSMVRIPDEVLEELDASKGDIIAYLKSNSGKAIMMKRGEIRVEVE